MFDQTHLVDQLQGGEDFLKTLHKDARAVSLTRLVAPVGDDTRFPFDRVLAMAIASEALYGHVDFEPSVELLDSLQKVLAWDRVINVVRPETAARYHQAGLPRGHSLDRFFLIPAQVAYFALHWSVFGDQFNGVWIIRDREGDKPHVTVRLTGGSGPEPEIRLAAVRTWEEALQAAWIQVAANTELGQGREGARRMNAYLATHAQWESLLALLYDLVDPIAVSKRNARAARAQVDMHRIRRVEA